MPDASLHLAGLLDSQYETLLAQWSSSAPDGCRGGGELRPHVPALLRQLIADLSLPETEAASRITVVFQPAFDLEEVVLGYGLLQRLVLELLERSSVPVSMRDVRRLGDWFTRAVAAAAAASADGAPRAGAGPRRALTGDESTHEAPEDTLRSAGQPPSTLRAVGEARDEDGASSPGSAELEQRLRLLSEAALIGTWAVDVASEQVSADPRVLELLGLPEQSSYPIEAFVARVAPEFRERCAAVLRGAPFGDGRTRLEAELRALDGEQGLGPWVEARAEVTRDSGGHAVRLVGTLADVTGRKAAELERQHLREGERRAREHAQRVSLLEDEFLATVSQEFRTPLTLLLGPTRDALQSSERRLEGRPLELVHENALRLLELVDNLLELGRVEAGRAQPQFEPLDVGALTAAIVGSFRALIEGAGLQLELHAAPISEPCFIDRHAWEQIIVQLLSNAFKFTLSGRIEVTLGPQDGQLELAVADTGTGIADSELELVFERFHRVSGARGRSFEGSGVGLALVRELARLHGGSVSAESRLGEGSCMRVRLPFGSAHLPAGSVHAVAASEAVSIPPRSLRASLGGRPELALTQGAAGRQSSGVPRAAGAVRGHVVLADDNADMRDYLSHVLSSAGWSVHAVSDGRAALESALTRTPDLVLSDVAMPRLDGVELQAALARHEATRSVPVSLIAPREDEAARRDQRALGEVLVKPFTGRELLMHVEARVALSRARHGTADSPGHWRDLLLQAPVAVSVVRGPELVYELVNPLARAMIGGRDVVGKSVREAFPELGADAPALRVLEHVYQTGEPFQAEEYAVPLDLHGHGNLEDIYFKFTCQPIRDAEGHVRDLLTVALDVSAQVQARRRAEALLEQLSQADKRKDEFLAMLAHELRNPMAAISTALILLEQADRDPTKAARYRDIARRQMSNLVRLVDDLLDVARITRGKVELRQDDIDLSVIVQHALGATRPVVEAQRHELRVTVAPGTFRLSGDGTRLEQVLVNLLTNAAKYTDPGGTISVTLEREESASGRWALLAVHDTGRGIAPDMLDRVFELFTQVEPGLDRRAGGLGLGLTLVKHLVEMHGGSVSAHSAGSGRGSEFRVRLPLTSDAANEARETVAARIEANAPRQRVLIVEDSPDVRELLEDCIRELGHDVIIAADGLEGAAAFEREKPSIALIDVGLPGIDGYEVARRARASAAGRGVRLVALSGYGGADFENAARAAGFDRHVTKPIELEVLRELLVVADPVNLPAG